MVGVKSGYKPLFVAGNKEGLVQGRQQFLLPNDAYPVLQNAFVWREQIKRKQGNIGLGRLGRNFSSVSIGNSGASPWTFYLLSSIGIAGFITAVTQANPGQITSPFHNLVNGDSILINGVVGMTELNGNTYTVTVVDSNNFTIGVDTTAYMAYVSGGSWTLASQPNPEISPGSVIIVMGGVTFTDQGNGTLTSTTTGNSGTINYITSSITLTTTVASGTAATATFRYFPSLPVMGIRSQEIQSLSYQNTINFDTTYAYQYIGSEWEEFIPGTTWTGDDDNFFWSTNYYVSNANARIFWTTNFSGPSGDPIRYTDGTAWVDFAPEVDGTPNYLQQCLCLVPFRGALVAFNTLEGPTLAGSTAYYQRIRWSRIGESPFTTSGAISVTTFPNSWRDDLTGNGGYLDIPTSEDIISVGFVRDNLVIYCERSTWQLRYTGRTISPFQVERVNSELGAEGTFSVIQFDTSLVGLGDKGLVECDSFKSERIDIKIPDLVYEINVSGGGTRVHGIRDFQQKLAYWIYPYAPGAGVSDTYPNRRLVYNYENDSWAIFTDSFTALGNFQFATSQTWEESTDIRWQDANFPWVNTAAGYPYIIAGNQQGYVFRLGSNLTQSPVNDASLTITDITGQASSMLPTIVTSPNHNLQSTQIIEISSIPTGTGYASLNGGIFSVQPIDANTFYLFVYNPLNGMFSIPQQDASQTYIGGGQAAVRDNFNITSKKFNFLEQGQNIQLGYIDVLTNTTSDGGMTLNLFLNYNSNSPINQTPQNADPTTQLPDTFFNQTVLTSSAGGINSSKNLQRVFCPVRGAFVTVQWTLSNLQMIGNEQENELQIDSQILYMRPAGRLQTQDI